MHYWIATACPALGIICWCFIKVVQRRIVEAWQILDSQRYLRIMLGFLRLKLRLFFELMFSSLGKTFKTCLKTFLIPYSHCFPLPDTCSYQPVGHLRHQESPRTQHTEPGAGCLPGTPWQRWLLCAQGVGFPGGGARWKPAAQNCEERLVNRREEVLKPCMQVLMWSIYLEKDKAHVYIHVRTCSLVVLQVTLMLPNT